MKTIRTVMVLLALALIYPACSREARADLRDKSTKVTLNEPMQVPGTVLAPGKYIFKLNDSDSNRHIVHIFNEDRSTLVTTILAVPNVRLEPIDEGILTYQERPTGQPVALEAWFYSGDTFGQQFVYPKSTAEELSRLNGVQVPSTRSEEAYSTGETSRPDPAENNTSISEAEPTYSASARSDETTAARAAQVPETSPYTTTTPDRGAPAPSSTQAQPPPSGQMASPDTAQTPAQLPNTASLLPLWGLLGSALIGVAVILKLVAARL